MFAVRLSFVLLAGCGGGLSAQDVSDVSFSTRAQIAIDHACSEDGGCVASRVRALDRVSICRLTSALVRSGESAPDSGIDCKPQ